MTEQEDRRTAILRGSAELFARQGVSSTTVRQIGDAVGVLSGSLYHHFPSKDAIVHEIIVTYLENLRAHYRRVMDADLGPRERIHGLIEVSLRMSERFPNETIIYQNELSYLRELPRYESVKTMAAEVQQTWLQAIESGQAAGVFRTDIDPKVFYRFIRDAVWLSVKWYRPEGTYTVDRLADDCTAIFLDGFAAAPGITPAQRP
ncbi:TetR/AcrR family transcriptional regulator [Pseudonocardia acaciae]|uniref:TetR/AcrR family transcriptional regulator n=1 Tax=Pseudonocardia acaciae TaxID=551276 RepID=UPI00048F1F47|nr:TetR/AcrR family transcriptional regulator [Pseudonocardia acaciae]